MRVEVPPVAAEFAVADAVQAERLLPGDDGANGLLLKFEILCLARLSKPLGAQQASHVVGAKRGLHEKLQSALAPDSFTARLHFSISLRRNAANSPEVLVFHSRPSCARRSATSGARSARVNAEF